MGHIGQLPRPAHIAPSPPLSVCGAHVLSQVLGRGAYGTVWLVAATATATATATSPGSDTGPDTGSGGGGGDGGDRAQCGAGGAGAGTGAGAGARARVRSYALKVLDKDKVCCAVLCAMLFS